MKEPKYHSIVVGGGIAGLTCAAYLAKEGKRVLLIEKNRECGGLVNTFSRDGFRFEAGVRALENAGIIFPMLKELGIELEVVKSQVSVGVEDQVLDIMDISSLKDYRDLLAGLFPDSTQEIDRLIGVIRKVMKYMDVLYGVENPNFRDMRHDRSYVLKELLPWLPSFLLTIGKINRMSMPVEPYLEKMISNPSLRDMISQHFFKNTPTFFALSYFSLYLDYFYPKGGVGKLATAVEEKYLEWGGELLRETTVEQVLASRKELVDQHQHTYNYEHLVWAADLKALYRIADPSGFSKRIRDRVERTRGRLLSFRGGDSIYALYLQVDESLDHFRQVAHGHFFYSPSRQGLGQTHWQELDALLKAGGPLDKTQLLSWLDRFVGLNTFEISVPGLKDPDMVPRGKTGMIVSLLAEYDLFKRVADEGWYKEFISALEDRILKVLSQSIYPGLQEKVMGRFSFTPLSYESRIASSEGAITGWSFQDPIPVIHKIQAAGRAVLTPLPSVYQAGQWSYSPAGVPMSILTGKLAAQKILRSKSAKAGK